MKKIIFLTGIILSFIVVSCGEKQKKRGLDYDKLKQELSLTPEQTEKFNALTSKYKKRMEENRAAHVSEGGKMNRVAFFGKMEEIYADQSIEIFNFLDETQMNSYTDFMSKNTRKRPRYNDELLEKIKNELALNGEQSHVLEAANNAFEKEFYDAHDIYHGNSELAVEYWNKFDAQRKSAIEMKLNPEQIEKFRVLVQNEKSPSE